MSKFIKFFIFLLFFQIVHSQSDSYSKPYYLAFDSIVGHDYTPLYNGVRFIDSYRTSKTNHRYFESYDFIKGDIFFDNQPFYNLNLKYDLYKDVLISQLEGDKSFFVLELNTSKLASFTLDERHFVNIFNDSLSQLGINGFLEEKYTGNHISFYVKHTKDKKERINRKQVVHVFNLKKIYVLKFRNNFFIVGSKRDFKNVFPNDMKTINYFYKNYKILLKTDPTTFTENLIKALDSKLSQTTSGIK